ncbi:MAG: four helix bundle protein [Verrucomicrobiae bacterium]|nr:four helix bundle protein [Verrucomicrobiae bacterium]
MASTNPTPANDRLESFGIYQLACQLFQDFWPDSEIMGKDYRGRELVKQQVRSLDSILANIEEGFGRGFGKELPQHLKIARGEARESRGCYSRSNHLLPADLIQNRQATLDHIIGGLTNTINTIESKQRRLADAPAPRHPSSATCHSL